MPQFDNIFFSFCPPLLQKPTPESSFFSVSFFELFQCIFVVKKKYPQLYIFEIIFFFSIKTEQRKEMFSFSLCSIDQNIPIICKYEAFFLKFYKFPGHFFKTKINQNKKQNKKQLYIHTILPYWKKITLMAVIIIRKIQNKGF